MTNPSLDLVATFQEHKSNLAGTLRALKANGYPFEIDKLRAELIAAGKIDPDKRRKSGKKSPQILTSVDTSLQRPALAESEEVRIARIVALTLRGMGFGLPAALPQIAPEIAPIVIEPPKARTLILTAFEARVKPDKEFIACLQSLAKYWDAEIILTLTHPEDVEFLPPSLQSFRLLTSDLELNSNLSFRYFRTNSLNQAVCGKYASAVSVSAIIPGLVNEMITLPVPGKERHAKKIYTTGSVGRLDASITDYSHVREESAQKRLASRFTAITDRKLGAAFAVAQQHIRPSALVVQVLDDRLFLARRVTMKQPGVLYDLNKTFRSQQEPVTHRPAFLNIGDSHFWHKSELAISASLAMIQEFQPEGVGLNDAHDGASTPHHEWDNPVAWSKAPLLQQEADVTMDGVQAYYDTCEGVGAKLYWIGSNHENWLLHYLKNRPKWRDNDHGEYRLILELERWRLDTNRHPIIKLLQMETRFPALEYVPEDRDLMIAGAAGRHGHVPVGGARQPNFRRAVATYGSYFQEHTHADEEWRDGVCGGHTSDPDPVYVKSASAWWWSNTLIQPDGSKQLLSILPDGQWKL